MNRTLTTLSLREKNRIRMRYLNWLEHFVLDRRRVNNYILLFKHLHQREFVFPLPMDEARAQDGIGLRDQFAREKGFSYEEIEDILQGPCSVLEMMVGLALRMEITLMTNSDEGDRTGVWFWGMLVNMKLGPMTDENYSREYVDRCINTMLYREYEPNGEGGLFTCNRTDMRDTEIWYQMNTFLIELDEKEEETRLKRERRMTRRMRR